MMWWLMIVVDLKFALVAVGNLGQASYDSAASKIGKHDQCWHSNPYCNSVYPYTIIDYTMHGFGIINKPWGNS